MKRPFAAGRFVLLAEFFVVALLADLAALREPVGLLAKRPDEEERPE